MIEKYIKLSLILATVLPVSRLWAYDCGVIRQKLDTSWEKVRESSRASIYYLRPPRGNEAAATAVVKWPFPPDQLFRSVWSYEQFPEFIPGVSQSTVIRREQQLVWVYQRLAFPPPLHDRHYIMVSDRGASQPQDQQYEVNWHIDHRYQVPTPGDRLIIPRKFQGCWDIRPTSDGGLDAIYSVEIEPGGFIPRWLMQRTIQHYLIDLMDALYRRLEGLKSSASE